MADHTKLRKFTKTQYEFIAESIARSVTVTGWTDKNKVRRQAKLDALHLVACDLAGGFYGDNPEFDRDKFLKMAGVK